MFLFCFKFFIVIIFFLVIRLPALTLAPRPGAGQLPQNVPHAGAGSSEAVSAIIQHISPDEMTDPAAQGPAGAQLSRTSLKNLCDVIRSRNV